MDIPEFDYCDDEDDIVLNVVLDQINQKLIVNVIDFLNSADYNGNENGLTELPNENVDEFYHNSGSSIQALSSEEIEVGDSDSSEEESLITTKFLVMEIQRVIIIMAD